MGERLSTPESGREHEARKRARHVSELSEAYRDYREDAEKFRSGAPSRAFGEDTLWLLKTERDTLIRLEKNEELKRSIPAGKREELREKIEGCIRGYFDLARQGLKRKAADFRRIAPFLTFFDEVAQDTRLTGKLQTLFPRQSTTELKYEAAIQFLGDDFSDKVALAMAADYMGRFVDRAEGVEKARALYRELVRLRELDQKEGITRMVPDELFEEMLTCHVERFREESRVFSERLPELQTRFKTRAEKAIAEGYLTITPEELYRRLGETATELIDVVERNLQETYGEYDVSTARVRIGSHVPPEMIELVYAHEQTHGLSGRTVLKRNEEDNPFFDVEHQRIGLRFTARKSERRAEKREGQTAYPIDYTEFLPQGRFRWLNEAVTETIALYLTGTPDSDSYLEERKLLATMYGKGIPRDLVLRAYFENYDADAEPSARIPAWKTLVAKLDEVYPKSGGVPMLLEIDDLSERIRQLEEELSH